MWSLVKAPFRLVSGRPDRHLDEEYQVARETGQERYGPAPPCIQPAARTIHEERGAKRFRTTAATAKRNDFKSEIELVSGCLRSKRRGEEFRALRRLEKMKSERHGGSAAP